MPAGQCLQELAVSISPGRAPRVREHQGREVSAASVRLRQAVDAQQAELIALRQQITKLAALVDHDYAAYREAQALLARREQELAELRKRLDSKPVKIAG